MRISSSSTSASHDTDEACEISVLIPAKNEAENLKILLPEIGAALEAYSFEIIIIDDGSSDHTYQVLKDLKETSSFAIKCFRNEVSIGQSGAVRLGLLKAQGHFIITTDGDGQNDPRFMPLLIEGLKEGGALMGMCGGQRNKRKDGSLKSYASKGANALRKAILKDKTRDSGCGLKAIKRDVMLRLPYFNGWHRFMAALVLREHYDVCFVDVIDRPRGHGVSHYGVFDRAVIGVLDLFGVWWLRKRGPKPLAEMERSL